MTRPGQAETVQGVVGKSVHGVLLIRHPMNPRINPSYDGYMSNEGTSVERLFHYCQRALPCAAKYTARQRFQERLPIFV